ncbi:MAG: hypothetical protein IIU55_04235 [Paludibacteraceae bacterium]|nr:hypothetical protein [Paludibacteraceae bacterium]
MKKLLILALCLLGICNARAEMMTAQEIILTEVYHMQPWDSKESDEKVDFQHGNRIYASIEGNQLSVDTGTGEYAYVEVTNQENGDVVAEEEFEGETTMYIPQSGEYELYIYTESGTVMAGEFSVE